MLAEILPYAVLASVFVVTMLGLFIGKPNKLKQVAVLGWKQKPFKEKFDSGPVDR